MIRPNSRHVDFNAAPITAAIRLARCWAGGMSQMDCAWVYDWTPGRTHGSRRETTWSEKRAAVMARYQEAKEQVVKVQALNAQRERAERSHGAELRTLREERRMLENKPSGVNIRPAQANIDNQIAAIIAAA